EIESHTPGTPCVPLRSVKRRQSTQGGDGFAVRLHLISRNVPLGKLLPILERTAPRKRSCSRMALGTCLDQSSVRNFVFIMNPVLRVVHNGPGFLGSQAVAGGKIPDNRARFGRRQGYALLRGHLLERF